jgi:hypothetical protein
MHGVALYCFPTRQAMVCICNTSSIRQKWSLCTEREAWTACFTSLFFQNYYPPHPTSSTPFRYSCYITCVHSSVLVTPSTFMISNSILKPTHHSQKLTKMEKSRMWKYQDITSTCTVSSHIGKEISPLSYLTSPGTPRLPGNGGLGLWQA